jgi:hypothetical protein
VFVFVLIFWLHFSSRIVILRSLCGFCLCSSVWCHQRAAVCNMRALTVSGIGCVCSFSCASWDSSAGRNCTVRVWRCFPADTYYLSPNYSRYSFISCYFEFRDVLFLNKFRHLFVERVLYFSDTFEFNLSYSVAFRPVILVSWLELHCDHDKMNHMTSVFPVESGE